MTPEDLFYACERAYRADESTDLRVGEIDVARIVAPSSRGNLFAVSRDYIRSANILRRLLLGNDVIVSSRGDPIFVITSLTEYERLTGRKPQLPEI